MRPLLLVVAALALRICGNDPPAAAPPPAIAPTGEQAPPPSAGAAPTAAARHGGAVVAVGPNNVEVIEKSDGKIEAYVTDAQGDVPPPASLALSIDVPAADAQTHLVNLVWSPTELHYIGTIGQPPAPGPLEVHLGENGAPPVIVELVGVPVQPGTVSAGLRAQAGIVGAPPPGQVVVQAPAGGIALEAPRVYAVPGTVEVNGGVDVRGPGAFVEGPGVEVRGPGAFVEGPGIEVRGPRAVFVAPPPPPPPGIEVGFGVNLGGGGVVEMDGDDEHHGHGEHGEHGHGHHGH